MGIWAGENDGGYEKKAAVVVVVEVTYWAVGAHSYYQITEQK